MAIAHASALKRLSAPCAAVCRSEASAERFRAETGADAHAGGIDAWLERRGAPERAIVATPVADLAACATTLMDAGCRSILLEKPGGVERSQIAEVAAAAARSGAAVHLAYNRRFFASVRRARELLAEDGGATSFTFEFTEVASRVAQLPYPPQVLANWEIANSTHVIDTAFFLGGRPETLHGSIAGTLPWHPRCARYAGHGRTRAGALFSYSADWDAPGRWGIEVNSRRRRLVLRPMETLQVQDLGTFSLRQEPLDDALDRECKPGLVLQAKAWLGDDGDNALIDIAQHAESIDFITRHILCESGSSQA